LSKACGGDTSLPSQLNSSKLKGAKKQRLLPPKRVSLSAQERVEKRAAAEVQANSASVLALRLGEWVDQAEQRKLLDGKDAEIERAWKHARAEVEDQRAEEAHSWLLARTKLEDKRAEEARAERLARLALEDKRAEDAREHMLARLELEDKRVEDAREERLAATALALVKDERVEKRAEEAHLWLLARTKLEDKRAEEARAERLARETLEDKRAERGLDISAAASGYALQAVVVAWVACIAMVSPSLLNMFK